MRNRFKYLYNTLLSFISAPFNAWGNVDTVQQTTIALSRQVVVPSMLAIAISALTGNLIIAINYHDFSLLYAIVNSAATITGAFFSFYVCFRLMDELKHKLQITVDRTLLFKLMAYSFLPFWAAIFLSGILINYPTMSGFLRFLGIYGVLIFAIGLEHFHISEPARRTRFAAVGILLSVFIYQAIKWSFGFALQAILYSNVLNN